MEIPFYIHKSPKKKKEGALVGEVLALVSGFFFAITNIITQKGLHFIPSKKGLFIVNLINALFFLVLLFFADFSTATLTGAGIIFFILAGFFSALLGRYFKLVSISRLGSSRTATLKPVRTILVLMVGIIFLGERISLLEIGGILLVLSGIALVIFELKMKKGEGNSQLPAGKMALSSVLFPFLTALSYGLADIFRKLGLNLIPVVLFGTAVNAFTAFILYCLYLFYSKQFVILKDMDRRGIYFFVLAGFSTAFAWFSWFLSLSLTPISIAGALKSSELLFTLLLSHLFLKREERLGIPVILGGLVVFIGVLIILIP